jgi:dihydrolipoamide dehydrogenase
VAAVLEDDFVRRGVQLLKGARASGIDVSDDGVVVRCDDGRSVTASHALLAIGSIPNTESLGLDAAGVEMDGAWIRSVDHHMRTNVPHIYVAGDVSGKLPLSSVATMQGRKIAEHVMGLHKVGHRHLDYEKAASAIFTDPEIAWAGLTENDLATSGQTVEISRYPWIASGRAHALGRTDGLTKILVDPETDTVLGVGIVGAGAGELIAEGVLAIEMGCSARDLMEAIHPHPTLGETLAFSAENYFGLATEIYRPRAESAGG